MSKRKKKFSSEKRRCVLCNRVLFQFEDNYVTGATGRIVCSDCLDTSKKLFAPNQQPTSCENSAPKSAAKVLTPQEIIYQLDKAIIGQNRAKRAIAVAIWKQLLRAVGDTTVPRTNLLLYGPTGCGKTALVREAAKIADLPFVNFDATTLSETGYRGRDAQDAVHWELLRALPLSAGGAGCGRTAVLHRQSSGLSSVVYGGGPGPEARPQRRIPAADRGSRFAGPPEQGCLQQRHRSLSKRHPAAVGTDPRLHPGPQPD